MSTSANKNKLISKVTAGFDRLEDCRINRRKIKRINFKRTKYDNTSRKVRTKKYAGYNIVFLLFLCGCG